MNTSEIDKINSFPGGGHLLDGIAGGIVNIVVELWSKYKCQVIKERNNGSCDNT